MLDLLDAFVDFRVHVCIHMRTYYLFTFVGGKCKSPLIYTV